jgi:hypothetical protein
MMLPIRPRTDEAMKNHRLPKMSERRPTRVKPTAKAAVHDIETQMMLGDGPIAALINVRVLAGSTHPKYPDIWARQVACIPRQCFSSLRPTVKTYYNCTDEAHATVVSFWQVP